MASTSSSYKLSFVEGTPDEKVSHKMLPSFAKFKFPEYKFMPTKRSDVGIFIIQGELFRTEKIISFQISVTVTN
jgi:hypothetical protein